MQYPVKCQTLSIYTSNVTVERLEVMRHVLFIYLSLMFNVIINILSMQVVKSREVYKIIHKMPHHGVFVNMHIQNIILNININIGMTRPNNTFISI